MGRGRGLARDTAVGLPAVGRASRGVEQAVGGVGEQTLTLMVVNPRGHRPDAELGQLTSKPPLSCQ